MQSLIEATNENYGDLLMSCPVEGIPSFHVKLFNFCMHIDINVEENYAKKLLFTTSSWAESNAFITGNIFVSPSTCTKLL